MKMAVNPNYHDAEAFAGIAAEIAHVRFHGKGYNQNYSREDYELDAQSVGYMICRRFGVPCEAPDVSNLAALYDGFDAMDRRGARADSGHGTEDRWQHRACHYAAGSVTKYEPQRTLKRFALLRGMSSAGCPQSRPVDA